MHGIYRIHKILNTKYTGYTGYIIYRMHNIGNTELQTNTETTGYRIYRIQNNKKTEYTGLELEIVMSMPSAAYMKCQSWGKFLALKIHCFVVNVAILLFFLVKYYG